MKIEFSSKLLSKRLDFDRGQDVPRIGSAAYTSWLEATPTDIIEQSNFSALQYQQWERHLAAINKHCNSRENTALE